MANEQKRFERVGVQLRQEIAVLLGRNFADPRLEGLVVTRVDMSADLRVAKVYFRLAPVGSAAAGITDGAARRKHAETALGRASGRLRREATQRLGLRVAPELGFVYDAGQDARDRIEQLLHEVSAERKA